MKVSSDYYDSCIDHSSSLANHNTSSFPYETATLFAVSSRLKSLSLIFCRLLVSLYFLGVFIV